MEAFHLEPHRWTNCRSFPWAFCRGCGLERLRNRFTDFLVKAGCNFAEHPKYREERAKAGRR